MIRLSSKDLKLVFKSVTYLGCYSLVSKDIVTNSVIELAWKLLVVKFKAFCMFVSFNELLVEFDF